MGEKIISETRFKSKTVGKETTKPRRLAGRYNKQIEVSQSVCRKTSRPSQWGSRAMRAAAQWGASGAVFESATGPWVGSCETLRHPTAPRTPVAAPVRTSQCGPHGAAPTPDGECARAAVSFPARWPGRLPARPWQSCLEARAWGPHRCHSLLRAALCRGRGSGGTGKPSNTIFLLFTFFSQFALCELPIGICTLSSRPRSLKCGFVLLKTKQQKPTQVEKCKTWTPVLQMGGGGTTRTNSYFENENITSF